MKRLFVLVFFLAPLSTFGQDTANSSVLRRPAPERRFDMSLFASIGGLMGQSNAHGPAPGLLLRRASRRNPHVLHRVGLGYGAATRDIRERAVPVSADTALLVRSFINERMFYGLAGLEVERHLWKRNFVAAGFEARAGYASGRRDSSVLIMRPTTSSAGAAEAGYLERGNNTWSVLSSGLFFAGFRTYDKRYTAGIDAFTGLHAAYHEETGISLFDMNIGSIGVRFSVGYRF